MLDEKIRQEFRLKNTDKTRDYFIEEIEQNDLISKKHKKVCTDLNYIEHLLILASTVIGCPSIYVFPSLVSILIGIKSSAVRLKICVKTAGINNISQYIGKREKSVIK